ncbi:hypothetical protein PENTCL1PPCAC_18926, partial [Pristionchus entomophagus]
GMPRPSKRKNRESSVPTKKEKKVLVIGEGVGEYGLGTEDCLSRLPNLCLLEVLKNLTRSDIENMKVVSQRMLPLASDQSLDKIKWRASWLKMLQIENGFAFKLTMDQEDAPIYQFEIVKTEDGDFVERQKTLKVDRNTFKVPKDNNNDAFVPDKFFSALEDVLRFRNPMSIQLCRLPFNDIVFTKLESVLKETENSSLICDEIGSGQITNDKRKSFAKLAKRFKRVNLQGSEQITSLINEEFLNEIVEFNLHDFRCNANPFDVYEHRFHPSKSILPKLIKFKFLDAAAMILNANWVPKLFMDFMDTKECKIDYTVGSWRIAVDQPLTTEIISEQITGQHDYEHFVKQREGPPDRGTMYHYIVRKRDEMSAKFNTLAMTVNGGQGIIYIVDVEFFGRQQIPNERGFYSPLPRNRICGPRRRN